KIAAAEAKLQDLQNAMADAGAQAKAEAEEELAKAKSELDKLAAEAALALDKARAAYKDAERQKLTALVKDVDELKPKAAKAAAKVKPQVDQALKDIAGKEDAVRKQITEFDTASVESLKTTKAKTEQKLAELSQAVRSLRTKLP